jgi:hypothetical protein
MANLHIQKVGVPFDSIVLNMSVQQMRTWGASFKTSEAFRVFKSHVNAFGLYEQWGSERKSVLVANVEGASSGQANQIMPSTGQPGKTVSESPC